MPALTPDESRYYEASVQYSALWDEIVKRKHANAGDRIGTGDRTDRHDALEWALDWARVAKEVAHREYHATRVARGEEEPLHDASHYAVASVLKPNRCGVDRCCQPDRFIPARSVVWARWDPGIPGATRAYTSVHHPECEAREHWFIQSVLDYALLEMKGRPCATESSVSMTEGSGTSPL